MCPPFSSARTESLPMNRASHNGQASLIGSNRCPDVQFVSSEQCNGVLRLHPFVATHQMPQCDYEVFFGAAIELCRTGRGTLHGALLRESFQSQANSLLRLTSLSRSEHDGPWLDETARDPIRPVDPLPPWSQLHQVACMLSAPEVLRSGRVDGLLLDLHKQLAHMNIISSEGCINSSLLQMLRQCGFHRERVEICIRSIGDTWDARQY